MGMAATSDRPATRRFSADEVWRMVEVGLLALDEPYELIDGELLYVSPHNPAHAATVAELTTALVLAYGAEFRVRVRLPIGGIADSIPEPDLAVVPRHTGALPRHPRADETLLVIEVSDTSVAGDVRKGAIYAAAGAPTYWLVDVAGRVVTVHTKPAADGTWGEVREVASGEALDLPGIEATLAVAGLFGCG